MLTTSTAIAAFLAPDPATCDDLTRRGLLGLGAAGLTGLLSACAADKGATPLGDAATTRVITDMNGREVEVPTSPQRVVFLNEIELAPQATTLGYVPYAVAAGDRDYVRRLGALGGPQADLSGVRYAGPSGELDLETVAALDPDLIFVDGSAPDLDRVAAVAPTVAILPRGLPDPLAAQRLVADVLGLSEVLEERLAAYEARVAELSAAIDVDWRALRYNIIDQLSPQYSDYVYDLTDESAWWPSVQVLSALGALPVRSVLEAASAEGFLEVSVDLLADFDADVVFLATLDDRAVDPTVSSLLAQTTAARTDQLFQVDANVWSYANGIQGRFDVLDDLAELLAGRELVVGGFPD